MGGGGDSLFIFHRHILPILRQLFITRKHSSRMRTACLRTVCRGGAVLGGGVQPIAVCHLLREGVPSLDGFHRRSWNPPPPVNRITDRCKNITFPQLRLWAVIIHNS